MLRLIFLLLFVPFAVNGQESTAKDTVKTVVVFMPDVEKKLEQQDRKIEKAEKDMDEKIYRHLRDQTIFTFVVAIFILLML